MAKNTQWINAFPPKGGLDKGTNPIISSLETLSRADNIVFTSDLRRGQLPGQIRFDKRAASSDPDFPHIRYLYDFWYRDGSNVMQEKVIKVNGRYASADTGADGNFVDITGSSTIGEDDRVVLETFTNRLILCSQSNAPLTYTGSGNLTTLGGSPPNGSLVRKHLGRLWIAGVDANPHRIYYSQAFDATTWSGTGTGSLDIDPDDNDPVGITAIFPSFFGELYVAKRNSIYQITGTTPSTFQVLPLIQGTGCLEHNSVARVQNDILFASDRGIHSLVSTRGGSGIETEYLSFPLHNLWTGSVSLKNPHRFWGRFIRSLNSFVFLYPNGGGKYASNAIIYNAPLRAWSEWPTFRASSIIELEAASSPRILVGRNDGAVGDMDPVYRTNIGGEINPKIKIGPTFPAGVPYADVGFKNLAVCFHSPQNAKVRASYKVDAFPSRTITFTPSATAVPMGSTFIMGVDVMGAGAAATVEVSSLQGIGKAFSLQLEKHTTSTPMGSSFIMGSTSMVSADTEIDYFGFSIEASGASDSLQETNIK